MYFTICLIFSNNFNYNILYIGICFSFFISSEFICRRRRDLMLNIHDSHPNASIYSTSDRYRLYLMLNLMCRLFHIAVRLTIVVIAWANLILIYWLFSSPFVSVDLRYVYWYSTSSSLQSKR